jgi:hypothetical protein
MKNHLRDAVEKMREYYIQRLIESGVYNQEDEDLYKLTLTELKSIVNKLQ